MKRELPPIFTRVRFQIPKNLTPPVLAVVSLENINEARKIIHDMPLHEEFPLMLWHHCWVETPYLGMLCISEENETSRVIAWNTRDKNPTKWTFTGFDTDNLNDLGKIIKAQFYQAAVSLHLYTNHETEVSVNTRTRNAPFAYLRQGDTLRFARAESLASAAGHARHRDYQRPEQHSGIRVREHEVRGYWRTYASGVRVWVRPHKRGNADLGRVTRIIET
jgi:hypothetical protein